MRHLIPQRISSMPLLLIFAAMIMTPTIVTAAGRVALVYGNGDYINAPKLANPVNDAALITKSLKSVGFKVITVSDGNQFDMRKGLEDFGRMAQNADIALFYFAGHGLQVNGRNWLIPVDANIESSTDLPARAISANTVLELMELSGAKARIAILDACRNNPLSRSLTRAATRGLAKIDSSAAGSMVIFATAPGQVALDGTGNNSPFSKALAEQILVPGLEVRQMIGRVRRDVMSDTNDKQVPWVNEAIVGEIFLASAPVINENKTSVNSGTQQNNASNNNSALEIAFWESIKDSDDADMLQLYVNKFPSGVFVDIARARIGKLTSSPSKSSTASKKNATDRDANDRLALLRERSLQRKNQMESDARSMINAFQILSSAQSNQLLSGIDQYYANQVRYYDKRRSFNQIYTDKQKFVTRWPQRYYQLRSDSLDIDCSPKTNLCQIEGIMDWEVGNSQVNKTASGYSSASYEVKFGGRGPRIISENGNVIHRN